MESSVIFSNDRYTIRRYHEIPDAAIRFLESISWGTEGTKYQHRNVAEHIHSIKNPVLFALWKEGSIQATTLISRRTISVANKKFHGYYFRYFAIAPALRGSGIMPRFSRQILESLKQEEKEKAVFFSYVEKTNRASFRVTEMAGLRKTTAFRTIGFSRFFPKWDTRINRVGPGKEMTDLLSLLENFYQHHSFVQFDPIERASHYYFIGEKSDILAGCQYHRVHWKINRMPGIKGKLILNIIPHLPLIKRLFNPRRFEFLALEAVFFKPGHEKELRKLIKGLLAKEKLHAALWWTGENCPFRAMLERDGRLGWFHSFAKSSEGYVMATHSNLSEEDIFVLSSAPAYVSAFDNI